MTTVAFPVNKPAPALNSLLKSEPAATTSPNLRSIRRKKILIIDDDEVILKTVSMKLTSQGYAVATATDASQAIKAVRDERPDLILVDISFPPDVANGGRLDWDGFQIIAWLRNIKEASEVPFIIITGGDTAEYAGKTIASRAVGLFHKPIDHRDLAQVIRTTLGESTEGVARESTAKVIPAKPSSEQTPCPNVKLRLSAPPENHVRAPEKPRCAEPGLLRECGHVFCLNVKLVGRICRTVWHWCNN